MLTAVVLPDELMVVTGRTDHDVIVSGGAVRATGFGSTHPTIEEMTGGALRFLTAVSLAVLALGASMLLFTTSRLASSARQRRLAVLQLLGVPDGILRGVAAMTSVAYAVAGAALGVAVAPFVAHRIASTGVFGLRWWPGDPFPRPGTLLVVCAAALHLLLLPSLYRR